MHHLCGVLENLQVKHVWTNMINSYNILTNEEVYFLLLESSLEVKLMKLSLKKGNLLYISYYSIYDLVLTSASIKYGFAKH